MRLLFDANLSPRLVSVMADLFPDGAHVLEFGMERSDSTIWQFAIDHGYVIVSKDSDFQQRSLLFGCPPKVIWLRLGNSRTPDVSSILRKHLEIIEWFLERDEESLLVLV